MTHITTYDRLQFIYAGSKTKRFHTSDTLTTQTVGEHSFGVAMLVLLILPRCRKEVLLAALCHDLAEHKVGDMAAPVKRAYPELKEKLQKMEDVLLQQHSLDFEAGLTDAERHAVKAADCMDGMLYCVRERRMGGDVRGIYNNFVSYVEQIYDQLPEEGVEVFRAIKQLWSEANER